MEEIFNLMDKNNIETVEYENKLENLYENYNITLKEKNINNNNNNNKIISSNNKKLLKIILELNYNKKELNNKKK